MRSMIAIILVLCTAQPAMCDDFDAQVVDIWLVPSEVYMGDEAEVWGRIWNRSDPDGPYGGAATFDVRIIIDPPGQSPSEGHVDDWSFEKYEILDFYWPDYLFSEEGIYVVTVEVYDVEGYESGWDTDRRFDYRIEQFDIEKLNLPPEAERDSPSNQHVYLNLGDQQTFYVDATDPDCNLHGTEWYLDGDFTDWDNMNGCDDSANETWTFTDEGVFEVAAVVYDEEWLEDAVYWVVHVDNHAPNASRVEPGQDITVSVDTWVEFTVRGTDQDCNLYRTEWYLNGDYTGHLDDMNGCEDTAKFDRLFDGPGDFEVKAIVYDTLWEYDSTAWTVHVDVPTGDLEAQVRNQDNTPWPGAVCLLYDYNYAYMGSDYDRTSDSSGYVGWSNLTPGLYHIEANYEGECPFPGREFWVARPAEVFADDLTFIVLKREQPYAVSFRTVRVSDGWVVNPEIPIAPSTGECNDLIFETTVQNDTAWDLQARAIARLDEDGSEPWDYANIWSPYYWIEAGDSRVVESEVHSPAFSTERTYIKGLMVETDPVGKTDGWDWTPAYKLIDLPEVMETADTLQFAGLDWNVIDGGWQLGLYSENVMPVDDEIHMVVSNYSGVGAQINCATDIHYGEYVASIMAVEGTPHGTGVCHGFFYYKGGHAEIDVEIISGDPGYVHFVVHDLTQDEGETKQVHYRVKVDDPSSRFVDYGFRWETDSIVFLSDGAPAKGEVIADGNPWTGFDPDPDYPGDQNPAEFSGFVPSEPGTLIINNWSGSYWWTGYAPKGADSLVMKVEGVSTPYDCPADVNGDEVVDIDDLFAVLGAWGPCDDCPQDVNDDGVVDIDDLFAVLGEWGPCP